MSAVTPASSLEDLERHRPECRVWLKLLQAARTEMRDPGHETSIPECPVATDGAPLVDGVVLTVSRRATDRWVRGLLTLAADAGAPASLGDAAGAPGLEPLALVEAAIAADRERLGDIAAAAGTDPEAFAAVAAVAAMPLLQACARRWASHVPPAWDHGFCPVCGAWPALAEERGLERERRLRCARCGGDWRTEWLRCPFCGTRDHARLGALVPEGGLPTRKAETCEVCRRYVKTVTTLAAAPAADVSVHDLATVDLDVAALSQGYAAAQGLGYGVSVRLTALSRWPRLAWAR